MDIFKGFIKRKVKPIPSGHDLIERAEQLGVSIYAKDANVPIGTRPILAPIAQEHEIWDRVMQAEKHLREYSLWIIALLSAIAAVISAAASWAAVVVKAAVGPC